ncbi:MAG: hypothetical protein M1134_01205 [Actinobacteria bacterium]|nr:hypothetical protein [Actinomycetota bacterium]MCL5445582.1 hypothetical protein [Actinomycetota bacterium]
MYSPGALWVNVPEVAGAIATALGFLGAVTIAVFYGRKATAQVAAEAYLADSSVLVSVRPSICAVGLFRLRFADDDSVRIRVTEMVQDGDSLRNGRRWEAKAVFGDSFVEGGETLTTTVVFPLGVLPPEVLGWRVSFGVTVERWPAGRRWSWADQVFVPRPTSTIKARKEDGHGKELWSGVGEGDQGHAAGGDKESQE